MLVDAGSVAVIDGCQGVGQVLALRAAQEAIDRAQRFGVGVVGVRNSNHFGMARYFTQLGPRAGCVSFLSTNASPAIAPWGGRHKALGNNPWSIAAPAGRYGIAVMDLANTVVARGKIYLAHQNGLPLPEGWAITADGHPTTDPLEAIAGTILPMGGPKGYVISFMMDVLSGVLTGSGFAGGVSGPYQPELKGCAGHLYLALNVTTFMLLQEFDRRMEQLIEQIKSAPLAAGFDEIYFPGELEDRNAARAERDGLFLPQKTMDDLMGLAALVGIPIAAARDLPGR